MTARTYLLPASLLLTTFALCGCQTITTAQQTNIAASAQAIDSALAGPAVTPAQVQAARANAQAIATAIGLPFAPDPGVTAPAP